MENTKIYIVSFSDSNKYLLKDSQAEADSRMVAIEKELNEFLAEKFPEDTFAYYTTPKVVEISPDREAEFKGYEMLDAQAVEAIKKELVDEIRNMNANKKMDLNAPFADVNAAAADVPESLAKVL